MEKLIPLKNYMPPQFPSLETAQSNPELLKRFPQRWQKFSRTAAAVACVGIMSFTAFATSSVHAGAPESTTTTYSMAQERLNDAEIQHRAHHGGAASGPFYVVSFTEQEALRFIIAELEAAGLDFSATTPNYSVTVPNRSDPRLDSLDINVNVGLVYFDIARRVGIVDGANVSAREVAEAFVGRGITVHVFSNPNESAFNGMRERYDWQRAVWEEHGDETMDMRVWVSENSDHPLLADEAFNAIRDATIAEAKEPARQVLIDRLTRQAQSFIEQLQAEGILPPLENATHQEIGVVLNGMSLVFDDAPIMVGGRALVPMRAIFEALNFNVEWNEEAQTINATRDYSDTQIEMQIGNNRMHVHNALSPTELELDVPPRILNGRAFVPLRAITTAIGADAEWDEETRTITIWEQSME